MYMYYFLKYCHGRVYGYGDNIVKHESFFGLLVVAKLQHDHKIILDSLCDRKAYQSRSDFNPLLNSFPACDIMLEKMYLSGRSNK